MPVAGYIDHAYTCSECTNRKPVYRQARSAVRLEGVVRDMMLDFKYHDGLWLLNELVTLLQACVETHYDPAMFDAVAYVPLFHAKRRERGYNQAGVLAQELAKRISKPLARRCLYRNRPTRTQTNLTPSQRLSNVRGAFSTRWNRWLSGRRLLLVDDVMTTGATVNACARVLKEGGASAVYVATVARR
jgi:ComF family protein